MTEAEFPLKNHWYRITETEDQSSVTAAMIVPGGVIIHSYMDVDHETDGYSIATSMVFVPECTITKTDRIAIDGKPLYGLDYPQQPPPIPYP